MQQQLEFPHTKNGDIDWKTLGNILSACLLGEVLCGSYVDYKYGKRTRDFRADTDWEFSYEEKGVIVLRKRLRDSPLHAFMGRTVIDAPVSDVVQYLSTHERRKEWDKYLAEIRVARRISPTDCILYMLLEAKQCLVKQQREFLFYERMTFIGKKYVRSAISVDLPEFPLKPKIPRADLRPGTGFVLEPYPYEDSVKTLISFIVHVDLKNLPPLIINRAMRRQPMSVYRIRRIMHSGQAAQVTIEDDPESVNTFTASDQYAVSVYTGTTQSTGSRLEFTSSVNDRYFEDSVPVGEFLSNSKPDVVHRSQSVPATMHKANGRASDEFQFKDDNKHLQMVEDEEEEVDRERRDSSPLFPDDYRKTPVQENGSIFRLKVSSDPCSDGVELHGAVEGDISGDVSLNVDDHFNKTPRQNEFLEHLEHPVTLSNGSTHDSDEFLDAQDELPLLSGPDIANETVDEIFTNQSELNKDSSTSHATTSGDVSGVVSTQVESNMSSIDCLLAVTNSTDTSPHSIMQELENGTTLQRQSVSPMSSDDEHCNSLPTLTLASSAHDPDKEMPQKVQSAEDILADSSHNHHQEEAKSSIVACTASNGGLQIDS